MKEKIFTDAKGASDLVNGAIKPDTFRYYARAGKIKVYRATPRGKMLFRISDIRKIFPVIG